MRNANDELREYNCSEQYHRYQFGLVLTDGALELFRRYSCFWFLDIIGSYQNHKKVKNQEFQSWVLRKTGGSKAVVTCGDGNSPILSQSIPFTDFEPDEATVWVEYGGEGMNVVMLPSEH